MSALRTVTCPHCGRTHLLMRPCACGGRTTKRQKASAGPRLVAVVLTFAGTAGILAVVALAVADAKGTGYGLAVVIAAWLLMHLCRLGYDWEDGIDVRQRMFPGPWDWPVKIESVVNLWTSERAFFRAAYLGTLVAFIAVVTILLGSRGAGP